MKKSFIIMFIIAAGILMMQACKKDKLEPSADKALNTQATSNEYTYVENTPSLVNMFSVSQGAKLKLNAIAIAALNGNGELPKGTNFPIGSVIIEEIYNPDGTTEFIILRKGPSDKDDPCGWILVEGYNSTIVFGLSNSKSCAKCHKELPRPKVDPISPTIH
jgi:hypothetical protein